jgi:hypothetical protein
MEYAPDIRQRPPYTRLDLAHWFNQPLSWVYANLNFMMEHEGFPRPIMGNRVSARWNPVAVHAWLDRELPAPRAAEPPAPAIDAALASQAAELDRRSALLGHGRVPRDR